MRTGKILLLMVLSLSPAKRARAEAPESAAEQAGKEALREEFEAQFGLPKEQLNRLSVQLPAKLAPPLRSGAEDTQAIANELERR